MGKVLAAMSGGVDSSVAARLLLNQGAEIGGAVMELHGAAASADARAAAERLGIPFYVFDFTEDFADGVIEPFISAYKEGLTPNPCVGCNKYIKFDKFLRRAGEMGYDCIATGHYARIERAGGGFLLKKGLDKAKDQSYFLHTLTQEQLARTLFPLGELTKAEVREIAREQGLINAEKRESQDICFIPDGDYAGFIEKFTGNSLVEGNFLDINGNIIGRHRGQERYTVGQRKGLGMGFGKPVYVAGKDASRNTVTLCDDSGLYSKTLEARNFNRLVPFADGTRCYAKIRYKHTEQPARVWQTGENTVRAEFEEAQRAITAGQAVVLYDGDTVLGGGEIM